MSQTLGIVVVCLDPNQSWLHDCLESIESVADQVVVVDSASATPVPGATIRMPVTSHALCNNAGVALCNTDWVMLLDHDDTLITGNAELLKMDLKCHGADDVIVSPCACFRDPPSLGSFGAASPAKTAAAGSEAFTLWGLPMNAQQLKQENHIPGGSWFKRSAWQKAGGFFTDCCPDWSFWVRLASLGSVFGWHPAPIYRHRVWPGSGIHRMKPADFKATQSIIATL